jgi:hypothetical protein
MILAMKTIILELGSALVGLVCCLPAGAQIVFTTNDFPSRTGEYFRGYLGSSVSVGGLPGATNGPQLWDLSFAQNSSEIIQRTDIVDTDDAGDASTFPDATYAERDTDESDSSDQAWRYYSLTNTGRVYYGFDDPIDQPVTPLADFETPTLEFPCPLQFGQSWSRTVDWNQVFLQVKLGSTHFTCQAVVDAYGTVILPTLGAVPALRVNEVDTYVTTVAGVSPQTNIFREYYWLVRGIGLAAEVISQPQTSIPPANFTSASTTLRVFEASDPQDLLSPVVGLQFQLSNGTASFNWRAGTNGTSYRIETAGNLTTPSWQLFSQPFTNSWSTNIAPLGTQEFFRVFSKP